MARQSLYGILGETLDRLGLLLSEGLKEMACEDVDVIATLA